MLAALEITAPLSLGVPCRPGSHTKSTCCLRNTPALTRCRASTQLEDCPGGSQWSVWYQSGTSCETYARNREKVAVLGRPLVDTPSTTWPEYQGQECAPPAAGERHGSQQTQRCLCFAKPRLRSFLYYRHLAHYRYSLRLAWRTAKFAFPAPPAPRPTVAHKRERSAVRFPLHRRSRSPE